MKPKTPKLIRRPHLEVRRSIRVVTWRHPSWQMDMVLPLDGRFGKPDDFLIPLDRAKLKVVSTETMTIEEYVNLPEVTIRRP